MELDIRLFGNSSNILSELNTKFFTTNLNGTSLNRELLFELISNINNDEKLQGSSEYVSNLVYFLAFVYYNAIIPTLYSNITGGEWNITDWLTEDETKTIDLNAKLKDLTKVYPN